MNQKDFGFIWHRLTHINKTLESNIVMFLLAYRPVTVSLFKSWFSNECFFWIVYEFFSANFIRKKLADAATLTLSTFYWVYYQVFLVSPYPKRTLSQSYWIFTTVTCFQLLLGIQQWLYCSGQDYCECALLLPVISLLSLWSALVVAK